MAGFLDWLFGGGAQAQTIPPVPQGAVPQPIPATVPRTGNPLLGGDRNIQIQAALAGLGQFGQNLAEQYRRRPVGAPTGQMGDVSGAVSRSMLTAYQRRQQEREDESERRWSELQAGNPALAGLPREVGQQVLARTLTREPPDPRRNFITTRTGIYRIGPDGNPQLVQGPGMGGGGAGGSGGGAGAPGGMFRGTSMEAQSLNILTRGDPASPEYAAVYAREAAPRERPTYDENGNMRMSFIYPDMSHFRPPTFRLPTQGQPQPEAPVAADPTGYVAGGAQATLQPADAPQMAAPAAPLAAPPAAPAPVQPPQMAQSAPSVPQPTTAAPPSPGTPRVVQGPARVREAPTPAVQGMLNNINQLARAERAIEAIRANPNAVGILPGIANLTGFSSQLWDRQDPQGVAARAAIADLGSLVIHDRSGAAVTAAEFPRLRPFIPQVGDSAETVMTKLARFREVYREELEAQYSTYGPSQGYRPIPEVERVLGPPGRGSRQQGQGAQPAAWSQQTYDSASDVPMTRGGALDTMQMRDGQTYRRPDGSVGRWIAARRGFEILQGPRQR